MTSPLGKEVAPVQIGRLTLSHRIVMPALSRLRAQPGSGIPSDLMLEYYSQRASEGGLIVTEAAAIAPSARGYYHAPGLHTKEQEASAQSLRSHDLLWLRCTRIHGLSVCKERVSEGRFCLSA
jgi:2,4-dienoyl-CoA reductase-like NADH-dependent reductase (Old Yellow Enzyme family)